MRLYDRFVVLSGYDGWKLTPAEGLDEPSVALWVFGFEQAEYLLQKFPRCLIWVLEINEYFSRKPCLNPWFEMNPLQRKHIPQRDNKMLLEVVKRTPPGFIFLPKLRLDITMTTQPIVKVLALSLCNRVIFSIPEVFMNASNRWW